MHAGDGNLRRLQFDPEPFGQAQLRGFRGGIGGEERQAAAGAGAGDDHQLPAEAVTWGLLFHLRNGGLAAVNGAEQVGVEDFSDVLFGHRIEGTGKPEAGVADQRVDAAIFFDRGINNAAAILGAGDVGADAKVLAAAHPGGFLQLAEAAGGQDEGCAAGGQVDGQGPSYPRAGAGDDRHHLFEVSPHDIQWYLLAPISGIAVVRIM